MDWSLCEATEANGRPCCCSKEWRKITWEPWFYGLFFWENCFNGKERTWLSKEKGCPLVVLLVFPAILKSALSLNAYLHDYLGEIKVPKKCCKALEAMWNWNECAWSPGRQAPLVRGKFKTYWPYPWGISREFSRTLETSSNIWGGDLSN